MIPDGTPLYTRNMTIGRWHDENKATIKELFEKESYIGLQKQLGMSYATAKGLFRRWEKAEQQAASRTGPQNLTLTLTGCRRSPPPANRPVPRSLPSRGSPSASGRLTPRSTKAPTYA